MPRRAKLASRSRWTSSAGPPAANGMRRVGRRAPDGRRRARTRTGVGEWRAGRLVRVPAMLHVPGRYQDPGVPDGRLALGRRGIALVGSVKSGALVEVRARGSRVAESAPRVRALARAAIEPPRRALRPQSAAIVIAILIGDRVGLDDEVQRRLQEAGTYHVIAISGGNIAILAGLMLWLLRVAGRRSPRVELDDRRPCWSAYAAVVGGGASVVRATVMAVIYLVARQAGHRSMPVNALAVTCAVAPAGDAGRDCRPGVLAHVRRDARHPGRRRPGWGGGFPHARVAARAGGAAADLALRRAGAASRWRRSRSRASPSPGSC